MREVTQERRPMLSMLKKFLTLLVLILLVDAILFCDIYADKVAGKIAIGLGYPFVNLKYHVSNKVSIEGRYAYGEGITVTGPRLYYNLKNLNSMLIFAGVEFGYIFFDMRDIRGDGLLGYIFIGGEHFLTATKRFAITMDFGASFISLEESEYNLSISGIEWIYNLGVNFYLK